MFPLMLRVTALNWDSSTPPLHYPPTPAGGGVSEDPLLFILPSRPPCWPPSMAISPPPPTPLPPPAPPHGPMAPWPYASRPDQMTLSDDFKGTHGSWPHKGPQCMPPCACSALPTRSARPSWPHPFGPYGPHGPWLLAPWPAMAPWPHLLDLKGPSAPPSLAPWPQPHAPRSPLALCL